MAMTENIGSNPASSLEPDDEGHQEPTSQVRPWVRFWARYVDYYLFASVIGAAYGFVDPSIFNFDRNEKQVAVFLVFFAWVFVEAGLLSTWGTTEP